MNYTLNDRAIDFNIGSELNFTLNDRIINFNIDNNDLYFVLNQGQISFTINAIAIVGGGFRLLEDGFYRLLEDGNIRLLQ